MSFTFKNAKDITFMCPDVLKLKNFLDCSSNLGLRLVKDSVMASLGSDSLVAFSNELLLNT